MGGAGREELKRRVAAEIERRADEIVALGERVWRDPELGFKEFRTAKVIAEQFERLGLPYREGLAITGVKAIAEGGAPGPTVAILGELDSILVADHACANPETGAAHCCGHNAQLANMVGAGLGLVCSGVLPELAGRVALFAVPAEEYVEIEYRRELRRAGKIEFLGGKGELVRLGEFDDVDMAMMVHVTANPGDKRVGLKSTNNGLVAKFIRFLGKAAHAGGAPDKGINALNAASLALAAIHDQRETFRDQDHIRVHPILTRGGETVNIVPRVATMETFVRGSTIEPILEANAKVDRALRGAALAIGAGVEITTLPGYLPLAPNEAMVKLYGGNAEQLVDPSDINPDLGHRTGSTDMGDLSQIMPCLHPYSGGARGNGHGSDYEIVDYETAAVIPAKAMAMTVVDLLAYGASTGKKIVAETKPNMTKQRYLELLRSLGSERTYREE